MNSQAAALHNARKQITELQGEMTARAIKLANEIEKLDAVLSVKESKEFLKLRCGLASSDISTLVKFSHTLKGREEILQKHRVPFPVIKRLVTASEDVRNEALARISSGARFDISDFGAISKRFANLTEAEAIARSQRRTIRRIAEPKNSAEGLTPLLKAAQRSAQPFAELVILLQGGQLRDVFYDETKIGLCQIQVSVEEIRALAKPAHVIDTKDVAARIGTDGIFVTHLVHAGFLKPLKQGYKRGGWWFLPADVDEFHKTYTTLSQLARADSLHFSTVTAALTKAGVKSIAVEQNRAIYLRHEAEEAMAKRRLKGVRIN